MVKVFIGRKLKGTARIGRHRRFICERCIIVAVRDAKWHEVLADRLRSPNGGGGDRPRPFIIITIWAGFVLVENRGGTAARAQVSSGICVMHLCWGL